MSLKAPHGIIDSHLHIWELGVSKYEWIKPELGFLYNDFPITEARFELSAAGVGNAILVQVEDSSADTEYMLSVAESNDWILGVIGWVNLEEPEILKSKLKEEYSNSSIVGFRHLIHDDPREGFLEFPSVRKSLQIIAASDFAFDIPDAWPRSIGHIAGLAASTPELRIVIDHLGKPPGNPEAYGYWLQEFEKTSRYPNVFTKLSGLLEYSETYTAATIRSLFDETLSLFGTDRIMFGGDWPVSSNNGHYSDSVQVLFELISTLSVSEQDSILSQNTRAIYKL